MEILIKRPCPVCSDGLPNPSSSSSSRRADRIIKGHFHADVHGTVSTVYASLAARVVSDHLHVLSLQVVNTASSSNCVSRHHSVLSRDGDNGYPCGFQRTDGFTLRFLFRIRIRRLGPDADPDGGYVRTQGPFVRLQRQVRAFWECVFLFPASQNTTGGPICGDSDTTR